MFHPPTQLSVHSFFSYIWCWSSQINLLQPPIPHSFQTFLFPCYNHPPLKNKVHRMILTTTVPLKVRHDYRIFKNWLISQLLQQGKPHSREQKAAWFTRAEATRGGQRQTGPKPVNPSRKVRHWCKYKLGNRVGGWVRAAFIPRWLQMRSRCGNQVEVWLADEEEWTSRKIIQTWKTFQIIWASLRIKYVWCSADYLLQKDI